MKYPKTDSRKLGNWEVIRCYDIIDKKIKLVKWGIRKFWAPESEIQYFDSFDEVLDYMNRKILRKRGKKWNGYGI